MSVYSNKIHHNFSIIVLLIIAHGEMANHNHGLTGLLQYDNISQMAYQNALQQSFIFLCTPNLAKKFNLKAYKNKIIFFTENKIICVTREKQITTHNEMTSCSLCHVDICDIYHIKLEPLRGKKDISATLKKHLTVHLNVSKIIFCGALYMDLKTQQLVFAYFAMNAQFATVDTQN